MGHRRSDLVGRQARLCQSFGQGDVGTQHVDHRRQVGVVVGVDRFLDDDGRTAVENGEVGVAGADGGASGVVILDGQHVDLRPDRLTDRLVAIGGGGGW